MKHLFSLVLVALCLTSCNSDDGNAPQEMEQEVPIVINKVAMLQIDYLSYAFEEGKELEFEDHTDFTISNEYLSPSDFGFVKLYYEELNELLFEGTIIWLGGGERSYPEALEPNSNFPTEPVALPLPAEDEFEIVDFGGMYPDVIPYDLIWPAINDLTLVKDYRASNPNAKINLFLYRPSVGIGDSADWDWIILLKN